MNSIQVLIVILLALFFLLVVAVWRLIRARRRMLALENEISLLRLAKRLDANEIRQLRQELDELTALLDEVAR